MTEQYIATGQSLCDAFDSSHPGSPKRPLKTRVRKGPYGT
jgi:hypothetical protein